jgi:hypothetical protein
VEESNPFMRKEMIIHPKNVILNDNRMVLYDVDDV